MPQADPDLVKLMVSRFGDITENGPEQFLERAGYKLTRDWHWLPKPGVADYNQMTRDEFDCLLFLCHEWDYGGLRIEFKMTEEPLYRKQREAMEDSLWDDLMGERLMLLAFFIGFAIVALLIWLE